MPRNYHLRGQRDITPRAGWRLVNEATRTDYNLGMPFFGFSVASYAGVLTEKDYFAALARVVTATEALAKCCSLSSWDPVAENFDIMTFSRQNTYSLLFPFWPPRWCMEVVATPASSGT